MARELQMEFVFFSYTGKTDRRVPSTFSLHINGSLGMAILFADPFHLLGLVWLRDICLPALFWFYKEFYRKEVM